MGSFRVDRFSNAQVVVRVEEHHISVALVMSSILAHSCFFIFRSFLPQQTVVALIGLCIAAVPNK